MMKGQSAKREEAEISQASKDIVDDVWKKAKEFGRQEFALEGPDFDEGNLRDPGPHCPRNQILDRARGFLTPNYSRFAIYAHV